MTVLFSDIDGTLIDHHSYDFNMALVAVKLLEKKGIPLIFCSSKTFAEQLHLQQQLGIRQPMIVESGGGLFFPEGYFSEKTIASYPATHGYRVAPLASLQYPETRTILSAVNKTTGGALRGYADVTDEELSDATNLHGEALQRARQRLFSETLLAPPPNIVETRELQHAGLALSRGGRFVTLTDANVNKGKALQILVPLLEQKHGSKLVSMAVGDSQNDQSMLAAADKAYLVKRHDGSWTDMEVPRLLKLDGIGPEGLLKMLQLL